MTVPNASVTLIGLICAGIGATSCGGSSDTSSDSPNRSTANAGGIGGSGGIASQGGSRSRLEALGGDAALGGLSGALGGRPASSGSKERGGGGGNGPSGGGPSQTAGAGVAVGGAITVVNGSVCSPVAARGCSIDDPKAQMVCSPGGVWQWSADCASGTICDPRPGLRVGQCVAPDERCLGIDGANCVIDEMLECSRQGLILKQEYCPTGQCLGNPERCGEMPACVQDGRLIVPERNRAFIDCRSDCSDSEPCAIAGQPNTSGITITEEDRQAFDAKSVLDVFYYLPSGVNFPTVPDCPDTRVFLLNLSDGHGSLINLPPEYWAIKVPRLGLPESYREVVSLACKATEHSTSVRFNSDLLEALLIATTDPNARPFVIHIY